MPLQRSLPFARPFAPARQRRLAGKAPWLAGQLRRGVRRRWERWGWQQLGWQYGDCGLAGELEANK